MTKVIRNLVIGISLYTTTLMGIGAISISNAPKIKSQSQLEQLVKKEKKKLGCNNKIVSELVEETKGRSDKIIKEDVGAKILPTYDLLLRLKSQVSPGVAQAIP